MPISGMNLTVELSWSERLSCQRSVGRSVDWLVSRSPFNFFGVFKLFELTALTLMLQHCSCPPTLDWGSCVSSLVLEDGENEVGYTAAPIACGLAGAVFELLKHMGRSSEAKNCKKRKNKAK